MNFSGIYKKVLVPKLNCQSLLGDRFAIKLKVARGLSAKGASSLSPQWAPCAPCRSAAVLRLDAEPPLRG